MSPDRYKASGRARDPRSWNRYAYTRGDPANRFDPSGRFDCDPEDDDCDPCPPTEETAEAGDPGDPGDPCCGGGGGGGGGGGNNNPPLTCAFTGGQFIDGNTGNGTWGTVGRGTPGYYFPTLFNFQASGGAGPGTYQWSNTQVYFNISVIFYNSSRPQPPSVVDIGTETLVWGNNGPAVAPPSSNVAAFDSPGLAAIGPKVGQGAVNSAFVTISFWLFVSVSSGGQTVDCPIVTWNIELTWLPGGGTNHSLISCQETIYTPPTP
jgi:hypothetical protein